MDSEAQVMLDEILRKPIGQMTDEEKGFVKARRDYLTEAQREDLAEILVEEEVVIDYKKLRKAELEALCTERGIDFSETATNADKAALLEKFDAENK